MHLNIIVDSIKTIEDSYIEEETDGMIPGYNLMDGIYWFDGYKVIEDPSKITDVEYIVEDALCVWDDYDEWYESHSDDEIYAKNWEELWKSYLDDGYIAVNIHK